MLTTMILRRMASCLLFFSIRGMMVMTGVGAKTVTVEKKHQQPQQQQQSKPNTKPKNSILFLTEDQDVM